MFDLADLRRRYEGLAKADLIGIIAAPDDYRPEAVLLARTILSTRGVRSDEIEPLVRAHREVTDMAESRQMDRADCERVAGLVATVRSTFPMLTAIMADPLSLEFPAQPGLAFPIRLNPSYDDVFWVEAGEFKRTWWLPASERFDEECLDLVTGLIAGRYRVVEEYAFGRLVRVQLQRQTVKGWERCANWISITGLLLWPREKRVLHNPPAGATAV